MITLHGIFVWIRYGRQVIVFEWSGYPVAIFDLGGDYASDIAISPDDQELFAIYDSPVPIIVRYNLPQLSVDR